MTGGVSLSIWMGGVARELNLLQQASWSRTATIDKAARPLRDLPAADRNCEQLYLKLLNLVDVTVAIDILSGTSAGGINAALLGLARARGLDLAPLRDIWLNAGDLESLLRDPGADSHPSLLRGDEHLLTELNNGIQKLQTAPIWAVGEQYTQVFITTTLLTPETSRFTDAMGTVVQETDHQGLLVFEQEVLANAKNNPAYDAALALAARSSASYPAAFEPAFLPFNSSPDRNHPDMKPYANITRPRWVADGGILMNAPVQPLLRAIFDRPADREVRRVLLYVVPLTGSEPDPRNDPTTETDSINNPLTLSDGLKKDVGALLNQSIAAELRDLRRHNESVDSIRNTRLRLAELGRTIQTGDSRAVAFSNPEIIRDYRTRQATALVRPVITALMRTLTTMPQAVMPLKWWDALATGETAEDDCLRFAANEVAAPWQPELPVPGRYDALSAFGRAAFDGARATALAILRAAFIVVPGERELLQRAVKDVHESFTPPPRPNIPELVDQAIKTAEEGSELTAVAESASRDYARKLAKTDSEPTALRDGWTKLGRVVAEVDGRLLTSSNLDAIADASPSLTSAATPLREQRRERRARAAAELRTYTQFLGSDAQIVAVRLFALHAATRSVLPTAAEVEQQIELVQVSADTRTALAYKRDTAEQKLTGVQLHHFGAFYKSSWRANDWMWGRLDGAGWLVNLLLDPRRVLVKAEELFAAGDGTLTPADLFYKALADLVGDEPGGEPVGTMANGEVQQLTSKAVQAELKYLNDPTKPIPPSLPLTAIWVARTWQRVIAAAELPVVAREAISTPPSLPVSTWATAELQRAGKADLAISAAQVAAQDAVGGGLWSTKRQRNLRKQLEELRDPTSNETNQASAAQAATPETGNEPASDAAISDPRKVAESLANCPVSDERLDAELRQPLFIRTVTKAAAVTTAAAQATVKKPPAAVRPVFATTRTVTLAGYRAAAVARGRQRILLFSGLALAAVGVLLAILTTGFFGLSGLAIALIGGYLLALGCWGLRLRVVAAWASLTVVGVFIATAALFARQGLFGTGEIVGKPGSTHRDTGYVGREILPWIDTTVVPWLRDPPWHVLLLLAAPVLLIILLSRVRSRRTDRRRTPGPDVGATPR
jgi:patatin-related protein